MAEVKHTPGPIWACKIGISGSVYLPDGCDSPMRRAVEEAFQRVTGKPSDFNFSGWSAELTEPELSVVEGRWPSEEYVAAERIKDAAPDLFEALEVLVAHTDGIALPTTAQAARLKARAALSKATTQQEGR